MCFRDEKNQEVVSPKEIELNEQRVKKWIKMFHNWDKLGADKLRKRVYKGIPDKCRSTAWMLLLNVGKYQSHQMGHKNPSASDRSKLEQSNQKFKERRKKYEVEISFLFNQFSLFHIYIGIPKQIEEL